MSGPRKAFESAVDVLIANRLALSVGIAAATSIVLHTLLPWPDHNPILILVSAEQPTVYALAFHGYQLFEFSTPFMISSMFFSLLYVHLYRQQTETTAGQLPPYPDARSRRELSLVLGEVHQALKPEPSATPRWFTVPERGLYTGIAVVGAIGSGKTTLLNVLADAIPEEDRILVIEDTAELHIRKPHVVSAESQTDTHRSSITFNDLLKAVLRHRPDRILVGEVRGAEARTLLDAMNTGHRGTLATIHASGAQEAVHRLAALAMRGSGGLGLSAVIDEVRRCLDLVVYISRRDGKRSVEELLEGMRTASSREIVPSREAPS